MSGQQNIKQSFLCALLLQRVRRVSVAAVTRVLRHRASQQTGTQQKKAHSTKSLAASNQVQARRPVHRILGRSVLNCTEHRNLDTRRPNVRQPSSRPKSFKEHRLGGVQNYQPDRDAKLFACPGRSPCLGPTLFSTVIFSRVKTLQTFPHTYSCPSDILHHNTN